MAKDRSQGGQGCVGEALRHFALALLAAPVAVGAQAAKVLQIGVLSGDHPNNSPCVDRLRRGLSEVGYVGAGELP